MMFRRSLSCAAVFAGVMILMLVGSGLIISLVHRKNSVNERVLGEGVGSSASTTRQVRSLGAQPGGEWYATVQVATGDRAVVYGPSELLRVGAGGATSTILIDPEPIVSVLVSKDGTRLAYRTFSGKLVAVRGEEVIDLAEGYLPLAWLDAKTLLLGRGAERFRVSLDAPQRLISVPSTSTRPL